MIRDLLLNKWFFTFIIGWSAFLILVDWKRFFINCWVGIAACGLELWQDGIANAVDMYHMKDTGISIFNVSLYFTFGITFTMGILFSQYIPRNPKLQLLHIIALSAGFVIFEAIVEAYGIFLKTHWTLVGSFFDNILIFGSLTWFKQYILYKTRNG